MNHFLQFVFIFYIGCTLGWIIELLFRRIENGKWVNPGFLIGPYLPIYGFGSCILTFIYLLFKDSSLNPVVIVLLMGILMTLIELIGGWIGLKNNVRLWDYSDNWGNYKGLICPLYSLIWTTISGIYYFLLAPYIFHILDKISNNLVFSYTLGIFSGIIIIDLVYSSKLYIKIKEFARDNNIIVKYEQLKMSIKDAQIKRKEKYSFLNPFKQTKSLMEYLTNYIKDKKNR